MISRSKLGYALLVLLAVLPVLFAVHTSSARPTVAPALQSQGPIATEEQLAQARLEWAQTEHAHTYDEGLGANTTCARCKSPLNWDPTQDLAAQQALDCGSCKRVPGAPRPELEAGTPVEEADWQHVTCDICHIPAGDSYQTDIAYWNQATGQYEPVANVMELCARCHEGQHGFEVVHEQESSQAHHEWECTVCHGAHSQPSACTDCHDPTMGPGASEHHRHPTVNCTGCHDSGRLTVWQDPDPHSDHFGKVITRRFAHTLTSWPSHNLGAEIDCLRCHHPPGSSQTSVISDVSCEGCHEDGAVMFWCTFFPRNPSPLGQVDTYP